MAHLMRLAIGGEADLADCSLPEGVRPVERRDCDVKTIAEGEAEKPMFKTVVTPFRVGVAALGWFALAFQYWIAMTGDVGPEPVARTINFFSYFTIECNNAVALAMTLPWLAPRSTLGQFFSRPSVRTAIATYIIFVGVSFEVLLRHLRQLQGLALMIDNILHYVIPVLFVIDWLFFVVKGTLKPKSTLAWLSFPV
jgi:hypothetical protein